jgi:hypothetical protein
LELGFRRWVEALFWGKRPSGPSLRGVDDDVECNPTVLVGQRRTVLIFLLHAERNRMVDEDLAHSSGVEIDVEFDRDAVKDAGETG